MSEKDEFNRFLSDEKLDKDRFLVEIPAEQKSVYDERIPSGYNSMEEIELRGRAFRGLAGGRIPWWVLISGWIIFGSFALVSFYVVVTSLSLAALIPLAIATTPLLILWRGTTAKRLFLKKGKVR